MTGKCKVIGTVRHRLQLRMTRTDAVLCVCVSAWQLMKRVRVERTHRWPVSKKSWSVQKVQSRTRSGAHLSAGLTHVSWVLSPQKKYDWNVEVKLLLPKAIIGEVRAV